MAEPQIGLQNRDREASQSAAKVDEIYDTVLDIFSTAKAEGIATYKAADGLAERRLEKGK